MEIPENMDSLEEAIFAAAYVQNWGGPWSQERVFNYACNAVYTFRMRPREGGR